MSEVKLDYKTVWKGLVPEPCSSGLRGISKRRLDLWTFVMYYERKAFLVSLNANSGLALFAHVEHLEREIGLESKADFLFNGVSHLAH
jgi:hypothetical protein